jgi:hypothetical protein
LHQVARVGVVGAQLDRGGDEQGLMCAGELIEPIVSGTRDSIRTTG